MNPNRKHPPTWLHRVIYFFARAFFRALGWRTKGSLPNLPKFVLLFSPHTSYYDNHLLAFIQASYGFEGYWLAAEKLFKNPLMRRFLLFGGARPVDRSHSHNLVSQYIDQFDAHKTMILGMAPEGTRQHRDHWKSGFYHIAIGADVPIVCLSFDYPSKTIEIGPTVYPTGDIFTDMEPIQAFYAGKVGCHPERMTPVRVSDDVDLSMYQRRKAS